MIFIIVLIFGTIPFISYLNNLKTDKERFREDYLSTSNKLKETETKLNTLMRNIKSWEADLTKREEELKRVKENIYNDLKNYMFSKTTSFKWLSGMIADFMTISEEQYIKSLNYSQSIAKHERALKITDLKTEKRQLIQEKKILEYELAYIKSIYPDLDDFIEFDGLSNELEIENGIRTIVSREEYQNLTDYDKNVLALEYYKNKDKTNWEIGRDYELSVGYQLEKRGLKVQYYGIEKKLEDLGRDLIAENEKKIMIIQCKYWAKSKVIHEKHITQLYGTFIKFKLDNKEEQREIIPVFITYTQLSETAKEFATALGVKVLENFEMKDYPLIKCKNNRDEFGEETKIYHLPLDLQYDKTIIKPQNGDFMAFSIDDAEKAGFRRAYKWRGDN